MLTTKYYKKSAAAVLLGVVIQLFSANALAADVEIEVFWPIWAGENSVEFRDSAGNLVPGPENPICDTDNCINNANTTETKTVTFTSVVAGEYQLVMRDNRADSWDGTNPFVIVRVDGVQVLSNDGPPFGSLSQTVLFSVGSPVSITQTVEGSENGLGFPTDAKFTLSLPSANASGSDLTVTYNLTSGSATANTDFSSASSSAIIPNGASSVEVTVPILEDTDVEGTENFNATITAVSDTGSFYIPSDGSQTASINILDDDSTPTTSTPLTLLNELSGYVDYSSIGGTLRTAANSDASPGNACLITSSSSATLSGIPATATIEKAYLYWAHSGLTPDDTVTFEGNSVTADRIYNSELSGGREFYGGLSDVTTIVDTNRNTDYDFSGLTIDNTDNSVDYCTTATVLGAWSLFVFYSDDSLDASNIVFYSGFSGESNSSSSFTIDGFFANNSPGSKATFLSWEGDPNDPLDTGETLSFSSSGGTLNMTGDGSNTGGNAFNSTIYDEFTAVPDNSESHYGVDLDTFDISSVIGVGATTGTATVGSGQDFIILNAVAIKVPSNLIRGRVFEDINYGGGAGRSYSTANGAAVESATVELYSSSGTLVETKTTDASGYYVFAGIQNGNYDVRVVNDSVISTRTGGDTCSACIPVQTFRVEAPTLNVLNEITDEVGGANPQLVDVSVGVLSGAQSVSDVRILSNGLDGVDFGFNFDTIVNTNSSGQGSLAQFITNSNALGNSGLNQEANTTFDPAAGDETSIFMIPSSDLTSGVANIALSAQMDAITDSNTHVDGRTQTANIGDTNTGTFGGGLNAGVAGTSLANVNQPEVQIDGNANGEIFRVQANGTTIRNLALFDGSFGILSSSGSSSNPITVTENLIGVDADGALQTRLGRGIRTTTGYLSLINNYIAYTSTTGASITGGSETLIQLNHFDLNGNGTCADSIALEGGSGITVEQNYIDRTAAIGIEGWGFSGGATINGNTITRSGQNGGTCSGVIEEAGARLYGSGSTVGSNLIYDNAGDGIVIAGGATSGNRITQNSTYNNGGLGIDLDAGTSGNLVGDGITLNDSGDPDSGANGLLNFPVFEEAIIDGTDLVLSGWARPGSSLELFITDIGEGTATAGDNSFGLSQDYGEGQTYLVTLVEGSGQDSDNTTLAYSDVDGNADDTNRFEFRIAAPAGVSIGSNLTATATIANSTSEFGIFKISRGVDFGDAPDASYNTLFASNGARHGISSGIYLGAGPADADADGQPNASATGDDTDANGDDEDGVTIPSSLNAGTTANISVVASVSGFLNGWIDFNADGDFNDTGEQIFTDQAVTAGSNNLSINIAQAITIGNSFARFRFAKQAGKATTPSGFAINGEVEDYLVVLSGLVDLAVAKTDGIGTYTPGASSSYTVTVTNNGPSNVAGVQISDALPSGVTLSANWSCTASSGSSCSANSGGTAGDSNVNLTADIINGGVITITIPVIYETSPSAY